MNLVGRITISIKFLNSTSVAAGQRAGHDVLGNRATGRVAFFKNPFPTGAWSVPETKQKTFDNNYLAE